MLDAGMYRHHNHDLKNNNHRHLITLSAVTIFTLTMIFASTATTIPAVASPSTTAYSSNRTSTTSTASSSGLQLSAQPIWEEQATTSGMTPINQTHSIVTFIGNGTLTVPVTGQTINMTNNGTAFISPVTGSNGTVSAYGKEIVYSSEDGDTTAITFHEIIHYNPATFEGKGVVIGVFDANATGTLAPFNGMFITGTHEEDPNVKASTITLWEWQNGIPLSSNIAANEGIALMNATNTGNTSAAVGG